MTKVRNFSSETSLVGPRFRISSERMTQIKVVENLTLNQIEKAKRWISQLEKDFDVKVVVPPNGSGSVTINGQTKKACHEAHHAFKRRIQFEDYKNTMEILDLYATKSHREEFAVDEKHVGLLFNEKNAELLKNYGGVTRCVLKIDWTGHVSIFGDDKNACVQFRHFILMLVAQQSESCSGAEQDIGGSEGPNTNGGSITTDARKITEEGVNVSASIDAAMRGDLIDQSDEDAVNTTTIKSAMAANPEPKPAAVPVNVTKPFSVGIGKPPGFSKGFGSALTEKIVVEDKDVGRIIGRQGCNRTRLQNKFSCQIRIEQDDKSGVPGMTMVYFDGQDRDLLKAAGQDVLDMLNKPGPWAYKEQQKTSHHNVNAHGGGDSPLPMAKTVGGEAWSQSNSPDSDTVKS